MDFRVVAPTHLRGENARRRDEAYFFWRQMNDEEVAHLATNVAGVIMLMDVHVEPSYVSFGRVRVFEDCAPATARTNCYLDYGKFPDSLIGHTYENGAVSNYIDKAAEIMDDNCFYSPDEAGGWFGAFISPTNGSYLLNIPVKWYGIRPKGDESFVVPQPMQNSIQHIELFKNGKMRVDKGGVFLERMLGVED